MIIMMDNERVHMHSFSALNQGLILDTKWVLSITLCRFKVLIHQSWALLFPQILSLTTEPFG